MIEASRSCRRTPKEIFTGSDWMNICDKGSGQMLETIEDKLVAYRMGE
jgi:hypothetical protein